MINIRKIVLAIAIQFFLFESLIGSFFELIGNVAISCVKGYGSNTFYSEKILFILRKFCLFITKRLHWDFGFFCLYTTLKVANHYWEVSDSGSIFARTIQHIVGCPQHPILHYICFLCHFGHGKSPELID